MKHLSMPGIQVSNQTLENFNHNISLSDALDEIAKEKEGTLSQLAIAWVLSRGKDIMVLVGCGTLEQVQNALKAVDFVLTRKDLDRLENILPKDSAKAITCCR